MIRYVLRRLLWPSLGRCDWCGALVDWGQPVRRRPDLAAFMHHASHMGEQMARAMEEEAARPAVHWPPA